MGFNRSWRGVLTVVAFLMGNAPIRAEPVTLKIWMHEHPPRIAIDKAIVAEFEKAHPDIKIDYQVIGASEYPTKLLTAFASGGGPDIFNHNVQLGAQYYNSRIGAPIDYAAMGYANEQELTAKYASGFDGILFAGKLYGVPGRQARHRLQLRHLGHSADGGRQDRLHRASGAPLHRSCG